MNVPKLKNHNYTKCVQNWLQQRTVQIFFNYAYNIGAAIVILGALFKLTHFPGANLTLLIGMGTEVIIFVISAFDISSVDLDNSAKSIFADKNYVYGNNTVDPITNHPQIDKTVTSVCEAYEGLIYQIRNAADNVESLDSQTKKMTENIEKLNDVCGRVIGDLKIK